MEKRTNIIEGSVYNYHYIDHGAQYRVYAIYTADNTKTGRVIKVPISAEESKRVLKPHLVKLKMSMKEIDHRVRQLMLQKQQLPGLIQGIVANDQKLMQALGNLKLVPVLVTPPKKSPDYFMPLYFTQDYVMPMAQFMHTFRFMGQNQNVATLNDTRRVRQLLKAIVRLHYRLWEYGIFDTTFKIENVGVVMRGKNVIEAILVDGAEHTYDIGEARRMLEKQQWRKCLNPSKTDHLFLPIILHEEYAQIMSKGLTIDALHKHWQRKSRMIERHMNLRLKIRQLLSPNSKKSLMLWVERQGLHDELRRGIPSNRVDTTRIPYGDLQLLLNDTRAGSMPLDDIARQQKAERTMYTQANQVTAELYRHSLYEPHDLGI